MKRFLSFLCFLFCFFILTGCEKNSEDKFSIVTSNFASYDFMRAITKDTDVDLSMLLKPGVDMHHFDPTPRDIANIQNSDIFVYVGGESEEWIDDILSDIDTRKTKVVRLMDLVDLLEEEAVEGMEVEEEESEEEEYDEHIWTSLSNAKKIISKLSDIIIEKDSDNESKYKSNTSSYISKIDEVDSKFLDVIKNAKRKEIIFADRFPLRYFVEEYGLSYYAAFPGCSEATEASAKTVAFLIDKVKADSIPVVFHIELSNGNLARDISRETGAKVLEFNAIHNISSDDFKAGITYVDIMNKNVEALKEALN